MKRDKIPPMTIARLPLYLRCLRTAQSSKINLISSSELARMTGRNAAQLRKDLSYLGELGTRGVGYEVDELIHQISKWLGIVKVRSVAITGMGKLGQALCNYRGFSEKGFKVIGAFDISPAKVGREVAGLTVMDMAELSNFQGLIDIGVVAVPAAVAQEVTDRLAAAGVRAVLNFAPVNLEVDKNVCLRNVDLATELQIIGFHLSRVDKGMPSDCCG